MTANTSLCLVQTLPDFTAQARRVMRLHNWGAQYGVGFGRTGNSYALPTKDRHIETLPMALIKSNVDAFLEYAEQNPSLTFLVTAIGCGLAGYSANEIAPMFRRAPANCVLPDEFKKVLGL